MIAVAIISVFYLLPKTEFVSSFALCSVRGTNILLQFSLSADWALFDCVIDRKVRDVIFEAILSLKIIILKIFAVNMLKIYALPSSKH